MAPSSSTQLRSILGLKAWKAWAEPSMHFIFLATLYLFFAQNAFSLSDLRGAMLVVCSLALYGACAVLVNDYFDIPSDKASGKVRTIYNVSPGNVALLFCLLVLLGFGSLFLTGNTVLVFVYVATYLLAISYSIPPFRFKGRGYMSLIVDVLVEKPLPLLLLFIYFRHFQADTILFITLAFVTHSTIQVRHQLEDYEADLRSNTETFAVKLGYERASRLLYDYLFPASAVLGGLTLLMCGFTVPLLGLLLLLAPIGYVIVLKLKSLNRYSQDRTRIPEWHKKEQVPMPLYFSYIFMWTTSLAPILMGILAAVMSAWWILLLVVIVASQYYYVHLHYMPLLRGGLSLARSVVGFSRSA